MSVLSDMWDLLKETPYERRDRLAREQQAAKPAKGKKRKLEAEKYAVKLQDGREIEFGK